MTVPEQYRLRSNNPLLGSDSTWGNNGFFKIPHYKITDYTINCKASDGEGWEHVSVSISSTTRKVERCPTWEEMCYVKNLFWGEDVSVMQLHPPKSEYVNMHKYCLHLWKPTGAEIPLPDSILVGIKNY